jgi:hypothetical protein
VSIFVGGFREGETEWKAEAEVEALSIMKEGTFNSASFSHSMALKHSEWSIATTMVVLFRPMSPTRFGSNEVRDVVNKGRRSVRGDPKEKCALFPSQTIEGK